MKDVIEIQMDEELYAKVMAYLAENGGEPQVTFPLNFTSDSVRIEDDSAGGLGGFYQSAYYTFDLGKMNDGTYWSDYLFDYYKSKMEFLEYGYDIPSGVAEQIPIFFNGCRVTYASSTYTTLEEITKDSLMFELEQNFPPLEGYEFVYAWDSIKIYWKEGGIMEVMVAVKKDS